MSGVLDSATHKVSAHPKKAAIVLGAAVALAVVMMYRARCARRKLAACKAGKSGFLTHTSNMRLAGMRPQWHLGSADAGSPYPVAGMLPDAATQAHLALTLPDLRPAHVANRLAQARSMGRVSARAQMARMAAAGEHFYSPAAGGACKPGDLMYTNAGGQTLCGTAAEVAAAKAADAAAMSADDGHYSDATLDDTDSGLSGFDADAAACGAPWDTAAVADAQAGAQLGSVIGAPRAERTLDMIISGDQAATLSDQQLTQLLHSTAVA